MPNQAVLRAWWRKRLQAWTARQPRQLRVRETLSLGDRQFLTLVECGARKFLIGRTRDSLALLAELPGCEGAVGPVAFHPCGLHPAGKTGTES